MYTRYSYLFIVIYFKYKGKKGLYYGDVFNFLNIQPDLIPLAYFISGCDDCSIKIHRFGWKKAFNLAMSANNVWTALDEKFPEMTEQIVQMREEYFNLINCKNLVVIFIYS